MLNKNKNQQSVLSNKIVRMAKKRGHRDGKNGVPRIDWGSNSVPYLIQLHKQFISLIENLKLDFEARQLARESVKVDIQKLEIIEKDIMSIQNLELEVAEISLENVQKRVDGTVEEVPLAKFARLRLVGNSLYSIFLFFLAVGEFLITFPALQSLIGEDTGIAVIIAMSVSVLTVATAHMIGITLKTKLDRSKPQTQLVTVFLGFLISFVAVTIMFLGYIRGANAFRSSQNLQNLTSDQRLFFLVMFFILLQITFVIVGSYLAFMHYSETEAELQKMRRNLAYKKFWYLRKKKRKAKSGQSVESNNVDIGKLVAQEAEVLRSKMHLLQAQYAEVCAIYRDANIHARKDEIDGAHVSFSEIKLNIEFS